MPYRVVGTVQAISGLTIEAADLPLPLGALCRIDSLGGRTATAEVIGFQHDRTLLMPLTPMAGVSPAATGSRTSPPPHGWAAATSCSAG